MKPGFWPDVPKMLQTIKSAGYPPVPDDVRLTVSGTVRKRDDRLVIEVDKLKQPVTLTLASAQASADTVAHLEAKHLDQAVTLEGFWRPPAKDEKGPGSLEPTFVLEATH